MQQEQDPYVSRTRFNGLVFFIPLIFTAFSTISAQNFQGGLQLLVGAPRGEFRQNVDRTGVGITGNIGFAPAGYAFMIGIEGGFMIYGTEDRREPFSTTIPDVTVRVETQNNFALASIFARLQPNSGFLRPFLEGSLGGNYLFTRTTIKNEGFGEAEVASSTNLDDFAFSYGGGAGLLISVYNRYDVDLPKDKPEIREVLIELRCSYRAGARAEYLKEGSIRRVNGRVVYDVSNSKTDLLGIQAGVAVRF